MPSLFHRFHASASAFPQRPALWVDKAEISYADLSLAAGGVAAAIAAHEPRPAPVAAVLAMRSLTAYAGVLGILAAGKGYVPLHPGFPPERTRRMLELSGVSILIVGKEGLNCLPQVLEGVETSLAIVLADDGPLEELRARFPGHQWHGPAAMAPQEPPLPSPDAGDTAYLLFTSGSTGLPKGVPVSQGNADAYIDFVKKRYQPREDDRFSQTFDLTFDLSVHDMFLCWSAGACLCCPPQVSLLGPGRFIRDQEITMWFSVPSVIMFMAQMRMLKPGSFPSLRTSLFCGEPLPASSADLWQEAAPDSLVENLYGPTEATIAISHYTWTPGSSQESYQGLVPIGWVFAGQKGRVAGPDGLEVPEGATGELLLAGSQVTGGYLNNPEKTAQQFVTLPDSGETVWYRTGDLVRRRRDGCLLYLGRVDHQVQVHGHRVELQEIDFALRLATGAELAATVAWPVESLSVEAVYGFVAGLAFEEEAVLDHCRKTLPGYMVPRRVFAIDAMPLNVNGKIDRRALGQRLDGLLEGK